MTDKKNIVIDLYNPQSWVNDIAKELKNYNIILPTEEILHNWGLSNYIFSTDEQKIIDFMKDFEIIAYHGCKTFNVSSYYNNGIIVPDKAMYYKLFKQYAKELNLKLDANLKEKIKLKLAETELEHKIFALLSPEEFYDKCSGYISFGSEFLVTLFNLCYYKETVYTKLLNIGKPTVIRIKIPISKFVPYIQEEICSEILKCYLNALKGDEYVITASTVFHTNIHPKYIDSHFYINNFYSYHLQKDIVINI